MVNHTRYQQQGGWFESLELLQTASLRCFVWKAKINMFAPIDSKCCIILFLTLYLSRHTNGKLDWKGRHGKTISPNSTNSLHQGFGLRMGSENWWPLLPESELHGDVSCATADSNANIFGTCRMGRFGVFSLLGSCISALDETDAPCTHMFVVCSIDKCYFLQTVCLRSSRKKGAK